MEYFRDEYVLRFLHLYVAYQCLRFGPFLEARRGKAFSIAELSPPKPALKEYVDKLKIWRCKPTAHLVLAMPVTVPGEAEWVPR